MRQLLPNQKLRYSVDRDTLGIKSAAGNKIRLRVSFTAESCFTVVSRFLMLFTHKKITFICFA